jgi:hypothetical protein
MLTALTSLCAHHIIAQEETALDFHAHLGNLIFIGVFLLALLAVGAWWLKR